MKEDSNKKYQLLIFDWDGTLADSEACIVGAMQLAIKDENLQQQTSDAIKNIIGLSLDDAILKLFPSTEENVRDNLANRYREYYFSTSTRPAPVFDKVLDTLHRLDKEDYFLAVATGKSRRGLDRSLKETELEKRFHFTRCADETHSKPNPQMLFEILDYFGLQASEALMIGDSEYDLQMAINANVESLAVSYGVHDADRLKTYNPIGIIHNIDEIFSYL